MWSFIKKVPADVWIVLCAIMVFIGFKNAESRIEKYRDQNEMLENTISNMNQQIGQYEIRLNDSVRVYQAEVRSLNFTLDNLKSRYGELIEASGIKAKDVRSVTAISTQLVGKDTVQARVDTAGAISVHSADDYTSIDVRIDSVRQAVVEYNVRDSLIVFNIFKQRKYLFGLIKKVKFSGTRVTNMNPKVTITGLQSINIIE